MAVSKDHSMLVANAGRPHLLALLQQCKKCGFQKFIKLARGSFIKEEAEDAAANLNAQKPRDQLCKECTSLLLKTTSETIQLSFKVVRCLRTTRPEYRIPEYIVEAAAQPPPSALGTIRGVANYDYEPSRVGRPRLP